MGQIFGILLKVSQVIILEKLQKRLFANTGMELAYRLPRMLRISSNQLHELVNRFFDIVTIQKNLSFLVLEGFSLALQVILGLILLAFYHPALLAFDICLVFAILFIIFVLGRNAIETSIHESYEKYNVVSWFEQISTKTITFSTKGARFFALDRANSVIGEYLAARDSHFKVVLRQVLGFLSLQAFANTSLLVLGVWLVSSGQLTIGQLVAAEIVVSTVLYSLSRFQKHLDNFYDLIAAVDKVGNLLSYPLEEVVVNKKSNLKSGTLELKEVIYEIPSTNRTIGPISFALKPGERIAIHGSNGSGKSILVDLMFGLKRPSSGVITYAGLDLRMISLEAYREQVSLVRKVEIVRASIVQNVLIGNLKANLDNVNQVLDRLGLLSEFLSFNDGLETELSEDGIPLSVSQTKRLMLARALVQSTSVLLIDETIDGLDESTRRKVLDVVFDSKREFSVVVTSKHPDIDGLCDRVIDLDQIKGSN